MVRSRTTTLPLTLAMNAIFVLAALLTARVLMQFFGVLAASSAGSALLEMTALLSPDLGFTPARTPYGGILDPGAVILIVVLLALEWILALVRSRG